MTLDQDLQLFLQAVEDLGKSKDGVIPLEDLLENFSMDYERALRDDRVIRIAVWNLSTQSPFSMDYQQFLSNVAPERSANYLVGSLANPEVVDAATKILRGYGQAALQFIRPPIPGTRLYEPLTNVITLIKQAA